MIDTKSSSIYIQNENENEKKDERHLMYRPRISPINMYSSHILDAPSTQWHICRPSNKTEEREWSFRICFIPNTPDCERSGWGEVRHLRGAMYGYY